MFGKLFFRQLHQSLMEPCVGELVFNALYIRFRQAPFHEP